MLKTMRMQGISTEKQNPKLFVVFFIYIFILQEVLSKCTSKGQINSKISKTVPKSAILDFNKNLEFFLLLYLESL